MKISIIGAGGVGTEVVNYLMMLDNISNIVLINRNKEKAEGEIMDYTHTTAFSYSKNTKLLAGTFSDCANSDIIIITAGAQIKQHQKREDLAKINSEIIIGIVQKIENYAPDAILIIVTNPVDVVTYFALKESNFNPQRVMSAGTLLDTARFMQILGNQLSIDPKNVSGYVLGAHGATGFIPWSTCSVCGMDLDSFCELNDLDKINKEEIEAQTLQAGYDIFTKKQNTNHGVAASVYRIVRSVTINEHSILPVGVLLENYYGISDVVLSVPAIVNSDGIQKVLKYDFTENELKNLRDSADHIKQLIKMVK